MSVLRVEGLNAGYRKFHVLFDITTEIKDDRITAVVGPNGSGKSTFLKTIFGLTTVYSGRVSYDGRDITGMSPHNVAKIGIAYLPQVGNVFLNLTVRENLMMASYTLGKEEARERADEVLEYFPVLRDYYERRADILSGGERQMLAMAMALMRRPKLMLFDEPTAGLAPKLASRILDLIARLRRDYGMTIVLVEQNARGTLARADEALLLVAGRIAYEGRSSDLLKDSKLGPMYLGLGR